jgi:fatty-acid desaturase
LVNIVDKIAEVIAPLEWANRNSGLPFDADKLTDSIAKAQNIYQIFKRVGECQHNSKHGPVDSRKDIRDWQLDQSEWFIPVIVEIVTEYAAWRDSQELKSKSS